MINVISMGMPTVFADASQKLIMLSSRLPGYTAVQHAL